MRVSRKEPRRARAAIVLAGAFFVLDPTAVGLQDLASFIASQPFVSEAVRARMISPFGTIHAATFNMPRPIGTAVEPATIALTSLDLRDLDITGSVGSNRFYGEPTSEPERVYPEVNRATKGDRLVPAPPPQLAPIESEPTEDTPGERSSAPVDAPIYDISMSLELHPQIPVVPAATPAEEVDADDSPSFGPESPGAMAARGEDNGTPEFVDGNTSLLASRTFFSVAPLGGVFDKMEPWAPGEAPVFEAGIDPDLKSANAAPVEGEGETIAGKGEVNTDVRRGKSPAERLELAGPTLAKAEKCLADAVYFEARGEQPRGQIAVAQVVLNRVFSGFYPHSVCGVVYQNANRKWACQFTFACDGVPDVIEEPEAWERAKRIAHETLDGKLWLREVGAATHYHAYWVRPSWVNEMSKLYKFGVHTFYRPRAWGDGAAAPTWGDARVTEEEASKKL